MTLRVSGRCWLPILAGLWSATSLSLSPAWAGSPQSADTLVGHYYLSGIRELGSELLLQADGEFQWILAYGAVDQSAEGHWTSDGATVTLIPRQASADSMTFQLGEKADWGERATHFLKYRRAAEALELRARNCPLTSFSREEHATYTDFSEYEDTLPPASVLADALSKADQARATAQAAMDQLKARPDWQKDPALVEEANGALAELRDRLATLHGAYERIETPAPTPEPLDLPSECNLPDWEKEAAAFRGVAIHVFDPDHYLPGDGVKVEARYNKGPTIRDVVSGGYAFFPLNNDQRLTALTLFAPGAKAGTGTILPVTLTQPSVQLVDADLSAMLKSPFEQMILTVQPDGALVSEAMPRGVYRKPTPVPPAPASIPADRLEQECPADTSPDARSTQPLSAEWQSEVIKRIRNTQSYPPEATRQGMEGTAYLKLRADRSGQITQIAIDRSSGHALLDGAAMKAVRRAQPYPRFPCDAPDNAMLILPVKFQISQ